MRITNAVKRRRRLAPVPSPDDHLGVVILAIGITVRELRARVDISQEELGYRAGVHRNIVGQVERGEKSPNIRLVVQIITGLALPLDQVWTTFRRNLTEVHEQANDHQVRAVSV